MDEKSKRNLAIVLLALSSPLGLFILFYFFGPMVGSVMSSLIMSIPLLGTIFAVVGGFFALKLNTKNVKKKNIALTFIALGLI